MDRDSWAIVDPSAEVNDHLVERASEVLNMRFRK